MGRLLAALARLAPESRRESAACRDPVGTQERRLRSLLAHAAGTEWGRRFDFAELSRRPDVVVAYRERVPLHAPEAFRGDTERMLAGARDVLWPGRLDRFVMSSGTSGGCKLMPLSRQSLDANVRSLRRVFLSYLANTGKSNPLGGVLLALPGATTPHRGDPSLRLGEVSGQLADHLEGRGGALARRIRRKRMIPAAVRDLADWNEKLDALADWGIARDVRVMAGSPSWILAILDRVLERARETVGQVESISELWPRLGLMISGGLPVAGYSEPLRQRVGGGSLDVIDTYGASEGFLAYQTQPDDPSLLLDLDGSVFFEFVPVAEDGRAEARRLAIGEVELGEAYQVILTTASGLWAYEFGDVVRFTSLEPPRIEFCGRTTEVLNSWREELTVEMARAALSEACGATGANWMQFHVAPVFAGEGRRHGHQWVIEFRETPPDSAAFALALDEAVRRQAPRYEAYRAGAEFEPLEVWAVPSGTFAAWIERSRGGLSVQSKVTCLSESRETAEALRSIAGFA